MDTQQPHYVGRMTDKEYGVQMQYGTFPTFEQAITRTRKMQESGGWPEHTFAIRAYNVPEHDQGQIVFLSPVAPELDTPSRAQLARDAFHGNNEALFAHMCDLEGYEMNGQRYPANGMDLARCIEVVACMPYAELAPFTLEAQAYIEAKQH